MLKDYKEIAEKYYGAKAINLDFERETEKSRETINKFIEEKTNKKIKDIIPEGYLNPSTALIITNAIYFKGKWKWEFDKSKTQELDFKITPNNLVKVNMMKMDPKKTKFNYANLEKLQILELPYKGDKISMLIILPKQGLFYDYEKNKQVTLNYTLEDIELSNEKLNEYKSKMKETELSHISIPKFKIEKPYFMNEILKDLGMPTAFSERADFSAITDKEKLYITRAMHKAYIEVDEKGTEAAASTAILFGNSISFENTFNADHPFIFIIQEKETGNILFIGRVIDPTKSS